ncbi:MAG TPA: ABC transporter permease [Candidatus Methylomirabilis sp.]|nr:ABC transporter permease [Candidatus Methylomirabilis sp.]
MTPLPRFRSWVGSIIRRPRMESEMDSEIRFHIEACANDLERGGLPRHEAMRRARMEFGAIDNAKEECREARGLSFYDTLLQDLRFGLRMLRKSPGFTAVALLTLAIGIGANTAIFSVVYGVLLEPLPYQAPSRLIILNETTPRVGNVSVSYPNFLDWRSQSSTFSQIVAAHYVGFNLAGVNQPESISGRAVSPTFLSMLGVRPYLGRDFDVSEEKSGAAPVIMLSYSLWQSHFGSDPSALGRTILLDGRSYTIIGVLPASFRWIDKVDVLEPIGTWLATDSDAMERGDRGDIEVLGRLASGVTFAQARTEMEGIAARLAKAYPASNDQFGVALTPLREAFVGDLRMAILSLFGAVICVLLIACANVANLLLVRGAGRSREIALRIAFGATRRRIIRQMLTESFVLSIFGGLLGLALAVAGTRAIPQMLPDGTLMGATVNLNPLVLLFGALLIVLAAFVFGLAPAARAAKPDLQLQLKEGSAGAGTGTAQSRLRGVFVVAELALSLVLLAGAGLMMKSLHLLLSVSPGFRPDRVLTLEMDLRTARYGKDPAILNFWQSVLDRVRNLPGVQSAAVGTDIPLTDSHNRTDITIEGMALPKPGSFPHPDVHVVSDGYASTLGVPLLGGRTFTETDNEKGQQVAMINALLARQFFPNGDAVGKRFMFGHLSPSKQPQWVTIVGVLAGTKLYGLANPARFEVYVPFRQSARSDMNLLVKSSVDPASLTSAIRGEIAAIDKDQPVSGVVTMNQLVSDSVSTRRFTLILLGLFSGLALVLAAIGIYGVISYSVAQRTRDIGIRMALGASQSDILRDVLGIGLRLTGLGLLLGLAGALLSTRVLASLLYGVRSTDALTFTTVSAVLTLVALFASYLPARRATRVDPIVALRYE